MIENEKCYILKDDHYYNLDIAEFYYFLYNKDWDYNKIQKNTINLNTVSEDDMEEEHSYIVSKRFLKELELKSQTEELNIKEIIENYNNKEMIEFTESSLLTVKKNNVYEEIQTSPYNNPLEIINIDDSIFKELKSDIEKNPFINCFGNGDFTVKCDLETGQQFVSVKTGENSNFIMDKYFLENMIEKYNEKEFDFHHIPPDETETEKEIADISQDHREEFQSHFDLAF